MAAECAARLAARLKAFQQSYKPAAVRESRFEEKDTVLITYADMVRTAGDSPLTALTDFLRSTVAGLINTVHLLPFYPYSSDDGFSVIDYKAVDPENGSWGDVRRLGDHFRLMFDAVVNHISAESEWFRRFRAGDPAYADYFTVVDPQTDLSAVFRPRALPLLTPVETAGGRQHVWTTFSDDQIDLNYANPDTLLAVMDTLLFYVAQGAEYIRLDAIAFIWKKIGTSCIHLPQTHEIIKLMRTVLDIVAPHVVLITETNVPHRDNISYFGNGRDEAQMVYNFSLPPLTLHAFHTGSAALLTSWAATLVLPSDAVTFFNFLASHDGIGLTPAKGFLSEAELEHMANRVKRLGGNVSYKNNSDGSRSAYELNINYLNALGDPDNPDEPLPLIAQRFLSSQAIMLALRGVPGIYFHSLFGSQNWPEGVEATRRFRTINRQKLLRDNLSAELNDPHSLRHYVFNGYRRLLQARTGEPAFHPLGRQEILALNPAVFSLRRWSQDGKRRLLCLHNVSAAPQAVSLSTLGWDPQPERYIDIVSGETTDINRHRIDITLPPFGVRWLRFV